MSIIVRQLSYLHPDREPLFQTINLVLPEGEKASLIGANGSGKSTLLRIAAGQLRPAEGEVICSDRPYYVPQHFGQYDGMSISQALGISDRIEALHAILAGEASDENFAMLNDDWEVEQRAVEALSFWGVGDFELLRGMESLSGGEKTKVFLAGMTLHQPEVILLDEPTNHLDQASRERLFGFIENTKSTVLVVSHDRALLNLLDMTFELSSLGIKVFGGNYESYKEEKKRELTALQACVEDREKALKQAKKTAREAMERQQKHDSRGEKQNAKKGLARIVMGNLKSQSENTTAKLKGIHSEKIQGLSEELSSARKQIPSTKELKLNIESARVHQGKLLVEAKGLNYSYDGTSFLWDEALDFEIRSGGRIAIRGNNGSGKTTLLQLILNKRHAQKGQLYRSDFTALYTDQEYSLLDNRLSVYEQAEEFNTRNLPEHELKMLLNRFVFPKDSWEKRVGQLSGGEKMRLLICGMQVQNNAPDIFILDEPTNNLDIQSMEILTSTIQSYRGTVLIISHDTYFLNEIGVDRFIEL